ncbi:universal stress protein [Enterococcus sp. JM9B]|uniref:universal stress protein n=1 Tax=Enterococcus sp. JM9B TaxID=1857216 RepID=UPI001374DB59|nr:universal stress protein [Enterococcus sp. JM9B]KAF1300015.1 hypothetical protein BAU16_13400 [Enterococcus sp. JM9B]
MFKKILVAVDESKDSQKAFSAAVKLAQENHSVFVIATIFEINQLNVYEYLTPETLEKKKQHATQIAENYRQEALRQGLISVEVAMEEGTPADAIIEKILPSVQPDLLVCGSKGKPNKSPLILGSQAALLAKGAPCSVMIIR